MNAAEAQAGVFATATDIAAAMADGSQTAEALTSCCLAMIAGHDRAGAGIGTMLRLNPQALDQARSLDTERARGNVRGKLHGIPIVVKDNIDVAGLPTSSGCLAMAGALPLRDAGVVSRLREAGAVILGKTNLSEFSFEIRSRSSLGGDVRNPFDRNVTAGGSSGGTAASIAAGFAVAGVGTDTGGSIRTPSSFNGLVGLRPSFGLIDRSGTAPLAPTTDTVGPMGRSVQDIAILLAAMTGTPCSQFLPAAPQERFRLHDARVGVLRQAFGEDTEIGDIIDSALSTMQAAGARIIDPVEIAQELLPTGGPHIVDWEFRPHFDRYLQENFVSGTALASIAQIMQSGAYLAEYREVLERRAAVTTLDAPAYRAILARHACLKKALLVLMDKNALDILVYPSSAVLPASLANPAGGWAPELAACSGMPALTLPVGRSKSGIPVGIEFLARPNDETRLLGLADDLERRRRCRYVPDLG
jgi:Asp-tRNA(Asn)/Glu-tRNA(Gln) amidotransferase A subunit family amidase